MHIYYSIKSDIGGVQTNNLTLVNACVYNWGEGGLSSYSPSPAPDLTPSLARYNCSNHSPTVQRYYTILRLLQIAIGPDIS